MCPATIRRSSRRDRRSPTPTTFADARAVLARYGIAAPSAVVRHLAAAEDETPKPGDRAAGAKPNDDRRGSRGQSLAAAAAQALAAGRDAGDPRRRHRRRGARGRRAMAEEALARRTQAAGLPAVLMLSGGETTVTVRARAAAGATQSSC
jgi:glycerate 2-kinase